jgi:hypothetical protein
MVQKVRLVNVVVDDQVAMTSRGSTYDLARLMDGECPIPKDLQPSKNHRMFAYICMVTTLADGSLYAKYHNYCATTYTWL